ncbi:PREDICTED: uncharacterized protein LOC106743616 [Dinoponera quadriceps]|uniref:Uncharacterized protein LOC106743616 n=1 Tax=Dinoponera quadriceps TaxID=609295 RepID=A0A6P3X4E8_DINQU|nr:PREDICTED: uncharacterized protein LOC106743616 [Dinoponera quadriceps]
MSKEEESSGEVEPQDAASALEVPQKDPNADIYENRGSKKIIRVVTVMAYLFSVSFVGILLSAYYIFLWEPPNPGLIERERPRTEPQVQLLTAEPYLEETDLLLENVLNRTYKSRPFLGRIAHDSHDSDPDEISGGLAMPRQGRLNAMLLKLKYSLMETMRETRRQNRTTRLSHEVTSPNEHGDSFLAAKATEKVLHSTENSSSDETSRGSVPVGKTRIDNGTGLYEKLTNFLSTLFVGESSASKSLTVSADEPKQTRRFGGRPADRDENSTVLSEIRNSLEKTHLAGPYTVVVNESRDSRSSRDSTMRRDSEDGEDRWTERGKNSAGSQMIDNDREEKDDSNEPRDVDVASEEHPNSQTSRSPSASNSVNCSGRNCSSNDECCKSESIARDRVSTDSSGKSRFDDDPRPHQPPDDLAVKATYAAKYRRNSEETQIEKMTARSTTIDNKQLEELDLSTTQRQKGLWEILTENTDIEETLVEFTSMSTAQDYRNNFTSIVNDDDESIT